MATTRLPDAYATTPSSLVHIGVGLVVLMSCRTVCLEPIVEAGITAFDVDRMRGWFKVAKLHAGTVTT